MKRLIIFILFSILLCCPAVAGAADDTFDPGKATMFSYPFLKVPLGEGSESNGAKDKKVEGAAGVNEKKEKEIRDKKVDDAIKKAWEKN